MSQQRKITHVIDMLIIFKYKIFKIIAASNNGFQ
ncbi:unknown [Alistipes putredinis CAG:67]|nr:unknown [Alistipes putredinis CAG:67]